MAAVAALASEISNKPAAPIPPPMHIVTTASFARGATFDQRDAQ
jgi:hypothetical protein